MFAPADQAYFRLSIHGLQHDFQVKSFIGEEAVSRPYRFDLQLVSEDPALDLQSLLHQPAFLQFSPDGSGIHGIIYRAAQGDAGRRLHAYEITLRPQLIYLDHRTNQRIFQRLTAPQIIARILQEHGIFANAYRFHFGSVYPQREYCVQYDESDLHFVQRLCEEEGIHFHFQHRPEGHELVFGDDQSIFPTLAPVRYLPTSGMVATEPVIRRFNLRVETRTSSVTRRDYDFEKPRLTMEASATAALPLDLEDYDYPGRFTDRERGTHLSQRALERHRSDFQLGSGLSDQSLLRSGHYLPLSDHPKAEWNDLWLITAINHEGKQPQVLEESTTSDVSPADGFVQGYRNTFQVTPWRALFRPPLKHPKPRILGSQSARVTGPKGEEIHCDEYDRVKVQFHWDREGQDNDTSSCWLRVSSAWAGAKYGGIAIPRVGMEVLVTFLEGDPDQPLISGCLYHGEHSVPYELPAHKTRSVFKSNSSPGGAGSNELRIEDRKDQEQIFIHAERDWDQHIEHDQRIRVGHERHDTVEGNSYSEFKAEQHITVHADRKAESKSNDHLTVGQSQHIKIGDSQLIDAGQEIHLKSGLKMVLEAGNELTLKAAASFVTLDGGGVSIVGPTLQLNSGDSPGQGSGAAPLLPGPLQQADRDKPGELLVSAQNMALQQRQPLCAICEKARQEMTHANA